VIESTADSGRGDIGLIVGSRAIGPPAGDVMMELVERAIPVIQHPPEARDLPNPAPPAPAQAPVQVRASSAAEPAARVRRSRDEDRRNLEVALTGIHAALERLRVQHAQLTSGAVLQQYQRQITFEVEDSRPADKVLSVQG
jgi:hypothetical protein